MQSPRVFRIGDKLISLDRAVRMAERALELREKGYSQQEAANRLQLDRSFVSRLESIGEIRKGRRVAVIGFPLANTGELTAVCQERGLDFIFLMNNRERWEMVSDATALDFFNRMLELLARLREFDTLVMITSEKWHQLAEALLDIQVVHIKLGPTPISEDRAVEAAILRETLQQVLEN